MKIGSEARVRHFLLKPLHGHAAPRDAARGRLVAANVNGRELRVASLSGTGLLALRHKDGTGGSEVHVPVDIADALIHTLEERCLTYHQVVVGDQWIVRAFEKKLYGLFLGSYLGSDENPPLPAGWALGREVSDDAAFSASTLAGLSDGEAESFVRALRLELNRGENH